MYNPSSPAYNATIGNIEIRSERSDNISEYNKSGIIETKSEDIKEEVIGGGKTGWDWNNNFNN